ncbi:GNAT family N-acetyltransferase [Candidatus Woesearchaeota archaeon]|jgi:ribosomal protein S18 acetylase RimI-like enzyme|nr:GNAT family N-acetyltransferase [Candidatus Woesearchaeota archaeon]MBT7062488.1 GNAT family N-acetyltransferase [Candidatus Woesearchaeota archaeon]MBT7402329.1 GNAT family N-acetyltransferase [Candidatus Woesearchaeota archaeon]
MHKIRRAEPKDAKQVRQMSIDLEEAMFDLHKKNKQTIFAQKPVIASKHSVKDHAEWFAGMDGKKDIDLTHMWYVLEVDGNVVGYINGQLEKENVGHLDSLYILKSYRGKGYATAMVKKIKKWFKLKKVKFIDISVDAPNKPAQKLYEKLGFVKKTHIYGLKV